MVVGVRKNMMLLFENYLSYIICVVGAGVTNAEWAWWFIKLNQRCWLALLLCVIFYHVLCEIWISCGYVWLRCCQIGDKCVVLFLKMWEIGVCSITKIWCDQSDLITEAPWLSYQWPTCYTTPLDGRSPGRSLWVATIPSTVNTGRIRLSVSTVNRTYELSGITHVTPFRKYGKHSTGPSTYGPWARTYSKLFSCKPVLTVCSYGAQSNEICTYGRVSGGTIPRVRRYGLLYLRTVEYDHCSKYPWLCSVIRQI